MSRLMCLNMGVEVSRYQTLLNIFPLLFAVFCVLQSGLAQAQSDATMSCDGLVTSEAPEDLVGELMSRGSTISEMAALYLDLFHSEKARAKIDLKSEEAIWQQKLDEALVDIPKANELIGVEVSMRLAEYLKTVETKSYFDSIVKLEQREKVDEYIKLNVCDRNSVVVLHLESYFRKHCSQILPQDLKNMNHLSIVRANVGHLSRHDLEGLTNLVSLDLGGSNLLSLTKDLFDELPSLKLLVLSDNPIEKLPENLFEKLRNLKSLDLSRTKIKSFSDAQFVGLESLEILYISSQNITELPEKLLWPLKNLQEFQFYNAAISEFPDKLFVQNKQIKKINLGGFSITSISPNLFRGLTDLKSLTFTNSEVLELDENIFADLSNLEIIRLVSNKFQTFPKNIFANNPKILEIQLRNNPIESLPRGIFRAQSAQSSVTINKTVNLVVLKELGLLGPIRIIWK